MSDKEYSVGQILVECKGYNMVIYDFYKVVRISPSSIWFVKLAKNREGDFQQPIVSPIEDKPVGEVRRKALRLMYWGIYDGNKLQEDHLD